LTFGSGPGGEFTDLVRLANVDAVVRRALTGHVTEEMQRKYSTVGLDEKRAAVAVVVRLVPPGERRATPTALPPGERHGAVSTGGGGIRGGSEPSETTAAGGGPAPIG
jgi:hypothetical protein